MLSKFTLREEGQGLVEYALILVLVAIVVIAALLTLGPTVSKAYCKVTNVMQMGSCGPVTNIAVERGGNGHAATVDVTVTVSEPTTVTFYPPSGATVTPASQTCSGSCTFTITDPLGQSGTLDADGYESQVSWPAKL